MKDATWYKAGWGIICCILGCADIPALVHTSVFHLTIDALESSMATPTFTFNIACDNVFNTSVSNDWTQTNRTVTTSVSVPKNKVCRLTLTSYFDGTNTFSPVSSSLVITISATGTVATATTRQYSNGSTSNWFSATQGGSTYTIAFSYAAQTLSSTTSLSPTTISLQTASVGLAQITPPSVSSVTMTQTKILLIVYYTLTAVVSNSTGCKYIDNSGANPTYTASDWISVNTAYNNASAANCPIMVPGSPLLILGNWTSLWQAGIKTLVIWANTVGSLSAYTTAMVGP